ncbi:MAG: zinc-dependent alcohol dehydrogenase family protein [Phototrophicales bacterium]
MRAVVYDAFGAIPTVDILPDPTPTPDGVVIRVMATGLCRSDWHGWQGHDPDIQTLPHVPGHELAGIVEAVGRDVHRWQVGDRVTLPFACGCGVCASCQMGNQHICDNHFQPGFTAWGSFAELVHIRYADVNLVRLPETIDFVEAASLGCRFITAFRGVVYQGRLCTGDWLAVHGCGGVGLSAVMIGAAMGANVIAVDIDADKLNLAQQLGAVALVNARDVEDVPAAIYDLTQGGAHVSVDALGSTITCRNSILGLRKRGRHIQIGLMVDGDSSIPMGAIIGRELEIIGSHGMQAHAYTPMLEMIASGILQPAQLIGQVISLQDAPQALIDMTDFKGIGITVIKP